MSVPDDLLWERWDEVDPLLESALELPPAGQQALMAEVSARDPGLGTLLERLIAHGTAPGVESPSPSLVRSAFGRDADLAPGTIVGRWSVVRRLGRGGMATVYEAERGDGAYKQRVALKILRRGLDTDDLVARFLTERQILSSLAHPQIARLLDGGSTDDGRPFLVM